MRTILRIMKTELRVLFFSPIAWLILIVFAFLVGMQYATTYSENYLSQEIGYAARAATMQLYSGYSGVMSKLLEYIYLFIPLATMGLMSRELSSGSIKLLYSSPVSNFQVIIGKYMSVLVFGLILCSMFIFPFIHTYFAVNNPDVKLMFTALLGVFITIAAYGAIGLFMSTITKYHVVAVVGTLAILSILNFIGGVGQEYDFVRDITYWLCIAGRSKIFILGMISTKDVLYFILVIFMFLGLSIVRLQGERSKLPKWNTFLRYSSVVLFALFLGYISSRPQFIKYYDSTATKSNTLTVESQDIVKQFKGKMTITTYVNIFSDDYWRGAPRSRISDLGKFEQYTRFKPDIDMKYVYYYGWTDPSRILENYKDTTLNIDEIFKHYNAKGYTPKVKLISESEAYKLDDIAGEYGHFMRVITTAEGKKAKLRIYNDSNIDPFEAQITTALKTMLVDPPSVGFVVGHKERGCADQGEKGYGQFALNNKFRYSLVNGGFKVKEINLDSPIPTDIDIIVIADVRSEFTEDQHRNFDEYIARGGNVFILGEPKRQDLTNPIIEKFGLRLAEGVLVSPNNVHLDDIVASNIVEGASKVTARFGNYSRAQYSIITPSAAAVEVIDSTRGFNITEILATIPQGSWIEKETTDFINEKSTINPAIGEIEKSNSVMLYLTRDVNGKEQRIFVSGDADCISSFELSTQRAGYRASNFTLITEVFRNLSYEQFPVEASRVPAPDNKFLIGQTGILWLRIILMGLIPGLLLIYAGYLLIKRNRK